MADKPKPKPGSQEWQDQLNAEIAEHDRQNRERDAKIDAELKRKAAEAAAKNDNDK